MNWLNVAIPLLVAVVSAGGALLAARRAAVATLAQAAKEHEAEMAKLRLETEKSSGSVITSEAKELWDANELFQTRILAEVSTLRTNSEKLVADYQGLHKLHTACESSLVEMQMTLLKMEAKNEAAKTMADAREEANNLLLEAALARERIAKSASSAKDEITIAAARARETLGKEQAVDDSETPQI